MFRGEAAKSFSHTFAGYAMIFYAIILFLALLWYLDRLFPEVPQVEYVRPHPASTPAIHTETGNP